MSASTQTSGGKKPSGSLSVVTNAVAPVTLMPKPPVSKTPIFDSLPARQQELVRQYLIDFNQTKAAERAGYSSKTARQQASQLFAKLNIRQAVGELVEQKTGLTKMTLLEEMAAIAMLDPGDYFEVDKTGSVSLKTTNDMTRTQRLAIESVKSTPGQFGTSREIKLRDKLGALKELATIMNLYPAKGEGTNVNVNLNNNIKTGVMVVPGRVSEDDWEVEGRTERKREDAINAQLRNAA